MVRYGFTAGCAAVVDVGLFGLFFATNMNLIVAASLSFLVATVVNYGLSARYVFEAESFSVGGYVRFLAAASLGFVLNVGVTAMAHQVLGFPALLSKVVGIGVAFFANFALNAFVVFRQK